MFYPIVVRAKEGKEKVEEKRFICFSDAEKYFGNLIEKMEEVMPDEDLKVDVSPQ